MSGANAAPYPPEALRPAAAPRAPAVEGRAFLLRLTGTTRHAEVGVVVGLCGAALAIRVITMWLTVDRPGDGPTHAALAYAWSKHPYLATRGHWLPGFTYWAGIALRLVDDPLLAPRLLNIGFGTLTVPALYALARRLFGPAVAFLCAATLVAFPLHVGLSVSSLTEPSYLFFTVASLAALAWVTAGTRVGRGALVLFLVCFTLAETTRYEAWSLVPLLLAYLSARLRSPAVVVLAAVLLLAFPAAWSAGNYWTFHNPLYGFLRGVQTLEGGSAVPAPSALANLARQSAHHLGWPLLLAALGGLIGELTRAVRRTISAERAAYAILVLAVWILNEAAARSLGPGLYDRYLLVGCVLAVPYAAAMCVRYCGRYRYGMVIGALVSLISVIGAYCRYDPPIWVTRTQPTEIIEVARWLTRTRYRNDAVLMTKMEWQSTYLPLYLPQLSDRFFIVSVWVSDAMLRDFVRDHKPSLLITQAGDAPYRARVERTLGREITVDSRVYSISGLEAYDISGPVRPSG